MSSPPTTLPAGWSSPVARQAHNLKAAGSNPAPATKLNNNIKELAALWGGFLRLDNRHGLTMDSSGIEILRRRTDGAKQLGPD